MEEGQNYNKDIVKDSTLLKVYNNKQIKMKLGDRLYKLLGDRYAYSKILISWNLNSQ